MTCTCAYNKPSWNDAPAWAIWLSQDEDGTWYWFESKPILIEEEGFFSPSLNDKYSILMCKIAKNGKKSENWINSLEKNPNI